MTNKRLKVTTNDNSKEKELIIKDSKGKWLYNINIDDNGDIVLNKYNKDGRFIVYTETKDEVIKWKYRKGELLNG
jgi:hypothetical protein